LASAVLGSGQATAAGTFAFTSAGTTPSAGTSSQGITFTPTDTVNYQPFTTTVSLFVARATPTITTPPTAMSIRYGQTLADSVLSGGIASVPGTFAFADPLLAPASGAANQDVVFTPTDTASYAPVTLAVAVHVRSFAPVDDAESAVEAGGTANGTAGFAPVGNVLDNETNSDGSSLAVTGIVGPLGEGTLAEAVAGLYGSLTIFADGSYSYVVNDANAAVQSLAPGGSLIDSFTYAVASPTDTATAALRITVFGGNDAATFSSLGAGPLAQTDEDTQAPITLAALLAAGDEADVDGVVTAFVVTSIEAGTLLIGASAAEAMPWDADSNAVIDATRTAYWTPIPNASGVLPAFSIVARDDGGLTSPTPVTVRIDVRPVNDRPILDAVGISFFDTIAPDTFSSVSGTLSASDIDSSQLGYGIVDGMQRGDLVSVDGIYGTLTVDPATGAYTFAPNVTAINALPFWGGGAVSETFTIAVNEIPPTGEAVTALFTVSITGADDRPTFTSFTAPPLAGTEDTTSDISLADLLAASDATNVDGGDSVVAFVVTEVRSGQLAIGTSAETATAWNPTTNAAITADLKAYWTPAANANGPLDAFSVVARDRGGNESTTPVVLQIAVAAVNDVPTDIGLAGTSVAENGHAGDVVGTFSTTDVDAGDTFTYTLVSGTGDTDNASFTIVGGTLKTADSFDFEAKSSYTIRVRSTDANGLTFEKPFLITVTDVNEAPTDISISATSVAENSPVGSTVLGPIETTDPDAGDTFTYTLVSGTGDTDNASFTIVGGTLKTADSFDFEAKSSYTIRVRSTDANGLSTEKAFTLEVSDVNETPTGVSFTNTTTSIAENTSTAARIKVADIVVTDDALGSETITLSGANAADFEVDDLTLYLKSGVRLDFETQSSYAVTVNVGDTSLTGSTPATVDFTLTVTDVAEPAVIGLPSPFANGVTEDTDVNGLGFLTAAGQFSVTDQDAGEAAFSISVAGAPGAVNVGTLSIDTGGEYVYAVRNSLDVVQALRAGVTHEDRFVIQTVDGTSRTVSFVITGVADVLSGVVADGYLKNAMLFADSNGNGIRDWTDAGGLNGAWDAGEGEAWTTTDDTGDFSFDFGDPTATLRSVGGVDLSTGLPFTGSLTAPAGSTVVNPLTTLVVATAAATPGVTVAAATAAVLAGLGLPSGIDLVSYDPLAQTMSDPTALQVQKAAANVANVIVVAVDAGIDPEGALANLAGRVAAATPVAPVDLTSATVLGSVLTVGSVAPPAARVAGLAAVNAAVSTATTFAGIGTSQAIVQAGLVPPTITSAATTTFITGSPASFQFVATGTPAATFSTTSPLPSGVTLSASGLLAGTPTVGAGGTYVLTVTASNGVLPAATQTFTLVVTEQNDITVSVVNNVVVLTLAPQGVAISNLSTSYINWNQLTITAQTRGAGGAITGGGTGIKVNSRAGTITVDLTKLTGFAGISVVGTGATDAITIGRGGVNLAAVRAGAASQSFRIDTGAGVADAITVGSAITAKGSGVVTLTTLGGSYGGGIQLGATVTTAGGSQAYVGDVTLVGDTTLSAGTGGSILVSGRIDGARRLTLAAGGTITLAAGVGTTTPLRGMTISRASGVAVAGGFRLDGSGTAAGTSGLIVAAGVNKLVFAPADPAVHPRSITGFSGSGIRFLGGTTGSLLSGIASTGNRIGLEVLAGTYTGTVIANCDFSQNTTGGVSLTGTTNLTLGRVAGGNTISQNAAWGISATGAMTGSVVQNNTLDANGRAGVSLNAATGLLVGGITANTGNRIINATAWGAYSVGVEATGKLTGTRLQGNLVSGNAGSGVVLIAAQGLTVGGTHPATRNVIQANLGNGLVASGVSTGSLVQGNAISGNRAGDLNTKMAKNLTVR
jgi:VCBS repeat-containing protein